MRSTKGDIPGSRDDPSSEAAVETMKLLAGGRSLVAACVADAFTDGQKHLLNTREKANMTVTRRGKTERPTKSLSGHSRVGSSRGARA